MNKIIFLMAGLLTSSAFANVGGWYQCTTNDGSLRLITNNQVVELQFESGEPLIFKEVTNVDDGMVEYSVVTSNCKSGGIRCHSMSLHKLTVSESLLQGQRQGEIVYEGDSYSCEALKQPHPGVTVSN